MSLTFRATVFWSNKGEVQVQYHVEFHHWKTAAEHLSVSRVFHSLCRIRITLKAFTTEMYFFEASQVEITVVPYVEVGLFLSRLFFHPFLPSFFHCHLFVLPCLWVEPFRDEPGHIILWSRGVERRIFPHKVTIHNTST